MAIYRLDLADRKLVDSVTDAETLEAHVPRMHTFFEGVREMRHLMAHGGSRVGTFTRQSGFTPDGTMQRCASVPIGVFTAMLEIDPSFGTDERKFLEWLNRNPQFKTTERVP